MNPSLEHSGTIDWRQTLERIAGWCALGSIIALPLSTTFTDVLLGLALLLTILAGNLSQKAKVIWQNPAAWLFIAFFGLYVAGSLYSVAPSHDIHKSLLKNAKLLYGALLIPLFVEEKMRHHAINALLAVITLVMMLSYAKAFGWISLTERYKDAAVFKSHIQTNFLVAFYAYIVLRRAAIEKTWRWLWLALFVIATIKVFFFSHGRSGYVVFGALIAIFGWQQWRWRGIIVGALSVSLVFGSAMFFSDTFYTRFKEVVTDSKRFQQGDNVPTSTALRLSFYQNAVKIIKLRPIFGSGTGSVVTRYQQIESNPAFQTHNPHNEYLNVAIQLGLVGLAFLLFFFTRLLWVSSSLQSPMSHYAQATVVAIAVGSTLNSWLLDTMQGHFFAMLIAVCFAAFQSGQKRL